MRSAEFASRIDERILNLLERDDLATRQKCEMAETLSIPGTYEVEIEETIDVEK